MESSHQTPHTHPDASEHEHFVEFYETTAFLIGTVADFLVPALRAGDSAIIVATAQHRAAFAAAISAEHIDLDAAVREGRYQALDAGEALALFMDDDGPDPVRFAEVAGALIDRAAEGGRHVKVYGEMVALLWADGDVHSTIALEDLWNDLAVVRRFALLCAYPMQDFDDDARAAFKHICGQHSDVVCALLQGRSTRRDLYQQTDGDGE